MQQKILKWISPLFALAIFLVALWALNRTLGEYHFADILQQLARISPAMILAAVTLTLLSYGLETGYDHLGLHYLRRKLAPGRITFVSFTSYALSHNIGFSLLTGGSVRYRMYSSWGLSAEQIARLTAFAAFSFILGMLSIGGLLLLLSPAELPDLPYLPLEQLWPIGALALTAVSGYLLLVFFRRRPLRLRGWQLPLPPFRQALWQILLGSAEWTVTASVLYPLLPKTADLSLPGYLQVYLLAQLVALFSHVPGGLGVFESVFLILVPEVAAPALFGSLLIYRALYYLLPFFLGILLLTSFETLRQGKRFRRAGVLFGQWVVAAGPVLLSVATLGAGAALLVAAAIPGHAGWLPVALPLPALESAHLLAALTGTALLLLARGVQRRLYTALRFTQVFLLFGIALTLVMKPEPWVTAILALVFFAMATGRPLFHRRLSLWKEPFTPGWVAVILIFFSASVWFGSLFHRPLALDVTAWFTFSLSAEAPRFLRASGGAALLLLAFAVGKRLRRPPPPPGRPAAEEIEAVRRITALHPSPFGHLFLLGDKPLLFSPGKDACLGFVRGERSLISIGNGIGLPAQRQELFWRFRELCDREGKWPVCYAIGEETLSCCLELGLSPLEIGHDVSLPLSGFSPEAIATEAWGNFRHMRQAGFAFEVVSAESADLWAELRRIGPEDRQPDRNPLVQGWLDADYVRRFPVGIVRRDGRIVAFALLPGKGGDEAIVDLVRRAPEAPEGMLEFLFLAVCLWGRDSGLSRLHLGMVPVADAEDALSAAWRQFGRYLFPHAEHFATLEELRACKERFAAKGQMRYLAAPDVLALPDILADIAGVGGWRRPG